MVLLGLFLFESGRFGADARNLKWLGEVDAGKARQLLDREYYKRLVSAKTAQPGIRWVLDLLPGRPRLTLFAIEAYLAAHWMVLPDGRIDGLSDAMALVRARFIGFPKTLEAKRLSLYEISPRDFERLLERLYEAMGYETELTPANKDGGRDVIAIRSAAGLRESIRVQCKLHTDPVGEPFARDLLGVVSSDKATKGVLAVTSTFTKPAKGFASLNPQLDLLNGVEIVALLDEYLGSDWPSHVDFILEQSRRNHP